MGRTGVLELTGHRFSSTNKTYNFRIHRVYRFTNIDKTHSLTRINRTQRFIRINSTNIDRKHKITRINRTYKCTGIKGRFNNYVTLKLPFLTLLPPIITLCHIFSPETSCVTSRSAPPPPFQIKIEILGFKKDRGRSKEISFLFHMLFFHHLKTPFFKSMY